MVDLRLTNQPCYMLQHDWTCLSACMPACFSVLVSLNVNQSNLKIKGKWKILAETMVESLYRLLLMINRVYFESLYLTWSMKYRSWLQFCNLSAGSLLRTCQLTCNSGFKCTCGKWLTSLGFPQQKILTTIVWNCWIWCVWGILNGNWKACSLITKHNSTLVTLTWWKLTVNMNVQ